MNVNNMDNIIYNTIGEAKTIELSNKYNNNLGLISENEFNILKTKLNILYNELNKIKNNDILVQGIFDKYYMELRYLKDFLIKTKKSNLRSFHDKIFNNIFKIKTRQLPIGITKIFEKFIKGITYFENEKENKEKVPIYHRIASCGNSSEDFRKKYLQCYPNNNNQTIKEKQMHIYKCYIERLIYDNMFKNHSLFFPEKLNNTNINQNQGHKYQLSERAKNFNSCFLGMKIAIDVEYKGQYPVKLIVYTRKNKELLKKETFIKTLGKDALGNINYGGVVTVSTLENGNEIHRFQYY